MTTTHPPSRPVSFNEWMKYIAKENYKIKHYGKNTDITARSYINSYVVDRTLHLSSEGVSTKQNPLKEGDLETGM